MIVYEALKPFFICGKLLPVLWQKPKMLQRRAFYYSYFPLRGLFLPSGTLKWISNHVMVCKWEFRFLDLLMAIFLDFLERFTIYSLLILKESVGQAKWQRNLGFGTYFLFIITYWLKLRFFENLANQAAMDRIKSKY